MLQCFWYHWCAQIWCSNLSHKFILRNTWITFVWVCKNVCAHPEKIFLQSKNQINGNHYAFELKIFTHLKLLLEARKHTQTSINNFSRNWKSNIKIGNKQWKTSTNSNENIHFHVKHNLHCVTFSTPTVVVSGMEELELSSETTDIL